VGLSDLPIVFVDQVHDNFHHDILFLRPALGYHDREGNEGAVGDALGAVLTVENAVMSNALFKPIYHAEIFVSLSLYESYN